MKRYHVYIGKCPLKVSDFQISVDTLREAVQHAASLIASMPNQFTHWLVVDCNGSLPETVIKRYGGFPGTTYDIESIETMETILDVFKMNCSDYALFAAKRKMEWDHTNNVLDAIEEKGFK